MKQQSEPTMTIYQERQFRRFKEAEIFGHIMMKRIKDTLEEMKKRNTTIGPTVHVAACKRASMDMTRALAQLRKSPYEE